MTLAPLYHLRQVHLSLSPEFQLRIPDWQHFSGQTLCILGPTGAGKTTFLKLLTGLSGIQRGSVEFNGRLWNAGLGPLNDSRQIALVPQRPLLLARSVRANLEYGARLRGQPDAARVTELLKRLGLEQLADRQPQALSGGQIQLVALARALVLQPRVLLLDEPTANLDPTYVVLVEEILQEWKTRYQTTLIWATHQIHQARRVADQVLLFLKGEIVETAKCDEFFQNPADSRTRDFVQGRMVY